MSSVPLAKEVLGQGARGKGATDLYSAISTVVESYKKSCIDNGKATAAKRGITLSGWLGGGGHPNNNKGATPNDEMSDAACNMRRATCKM